MLAWILTCVAAQAPAPARPLLDEKLQQRILQHAALAAPRTDSTNRYELSEDAARLGQRLFFEPRLSQNGAIACASCHDPLHAFTDGKQLAEGLAQADRHTPHLWNVARQRWFFWDGHADSLWSQALGPIENELEMGGDRVSVVRLLSADALLASEYERVFGKLPPMQDRARFPGRAKPQIDIETGAPLDGALARAWNSIHASDQDSVNRAFANVGKALAAYERKLESCDSAFDRFARALSNGASAEQALYPDAALRGLVLFVGKANCRSCHAGPNFSDGEFHDIGVPALRGQPPRDSARLLGIERMRRDPFNAAGAYSDDAAGQRALELRHIVASSENWGQFKTPSLRNVALTAPYMHQGQFARLDDVLDYYSTMQGALPAGHHGELLMKPLELSAAERSDLKAFLESLTDDSLPDELRRAPPR